MVEWDLRVPLRHILAAGSTLDPPKLLFSAELIATSAGRVDMFVFSD
jgi:hypothetical protein